MKPLRPNCARTSLRHIYPAHVRASATEHKRLDKAQHGGLLVLSTGAKET
jgi:hypothetical protein